ncbi:MAG: hypothetical protein ACLFNK_05335 [Candidatus Woesearchaeota archaeon]
MRKELHLIKHSPVHKHGGKIYLKKQATWNYFTGNFNVIIHAPVKEVKEIDINKFEPARENIKINPIDSPPSKTKPYKCFLFYKRLKDKIGDESIVYIGMQQKRGKFLMPLVFWNNPKVFRQIDYTATLPHISTFPFYNPIKFIVICLFFPVIKPLYKLWATMITRGHPIIITGPATFDRKNHLNKIEITSCPAIPENLTVEKKDGFSNKICFIGKGSLRKGLHVILCALSSMDNPPELVIIGKDRFDKRLRRKFPNVS